MHRLLARQLRKLGLASSIAPSDEHWKALLERVSDTYGQADSDRYTLERSLQISSDEIQAMYQQQKATAEGHLHALISALPDLVFMFNEDGRCLEVIADGEKSLFSPANEIKGRLLAEFVPADQAATFLSAIHDCLDSDSLRVVEYKLPKKNDMSVFEGRITPTGLTIQDRRTVLFLARDVTELSRSRDELRHVATHDALTGLPNRTSLKDRLRQAVSRSKRLGSKGALMVLDLDRFKQVNDSLGHQVGDRLLEKVADRLREATRKEDSIFRFGGDEFVVILEDLGSSADAGSIAQKILDVFAEPISLAGFDLDVTASVGVTVFPDDQEDSDELLRNADNAMYAAKEAGRNQFAYYTQELGNNALAYLSLEARLRSAIEHEELQLAYQPQFRLSDGLLVGLEALARWPSADPAHRSPAAFIPVAEMSGLIEPLGIWVLNEACRQAARWRAGGHVFGQIGVNLSCRQLNSPRLAEQVGKALRRNELPGSFLEFEITESMVLKEGGIAHTNIRKFADLGIGFAIDDFGTGHSSLVNLKRLPLTRLKIDRSFVDGLGGDRNDEAITAASIALGKQLGLEIVAEGVETRVQAEFLKKHACDVVQGYLYGKPLPAEEIEQTFFSENAALKLDAM